MPCVANFVGADPLACPPSPADAVPCYTGAAARGGAGFPPPLCPTSNPETSGLASNLCLGCGTCLEARGIPPESLIPEVRRSNLDELAAWTEESEKVVTF